YVVLLFFFSSRRRHTRWPRDWSSDVCSSDLLYGRVLARLHLSRRPRSASPCAPPSGPADPHARGIGIDRRRPDGDVVDRGAERRSEEHTSELQSRGHLVCRLLLEKKKTDAQM